MEGIEVIEVHKEENINNEHYYYERYRDKEKFRKEKEYVSHFNKYHKYNFPFYCETCDQGFYTEKSLDYHYRKTGH